MSHLYGQVVLRYEFEIARAELNEVLLELKISQERIRIIGGVVDDPAELRRRGAAAKPTSNETINILFFIESFLSVFLSLRDLKPWCDLHSREARGRRTSRPSRDDLRES